jgi:hypothetical protein
MEPDIREKFAAALALSRENHRIAMAETAEKHRIAMEEIDRQAKASEARGKRLEAKFKRRHEAAMKRMDQFDKSLVGVRKLIVAGMRVVNHLAKEDREARAENRAFKDEMREFKTGVHPRSV